MYQILKYRVLWKKRLSSTQKGKKFKEKKTEGNTALI